ncbi:MAG TPA: UvrB/UvrC motif-containing protein [Tepidisphaeraceae bacterium]|nr:UvrB/UvrC motif-containing protein [Tepidisphaeraceae bacterium]
MNKCDKCSKQATVHLTEIQNGKTVIRHLCEQCAAQGDGLISKPHGHTPINQLLADFVNLHSGLPTKEGNATCEHCGMTWGDFRKDGLLGCEHDYELFERDLTPLVQRAHENATHHVGKVPRRASGGAGAAAAAAASSGAARKVAELTRLRKDLARAVEAEDYERAAKLRDQIKDAEGPTRADAK